MKKKILIALILLATNVNAKTIYTDYVFDGYLKERGIESEIYKYEPVTFHKFYRLGRTNEVYQEENENLPNSPYIDYDDYIIKNTITKTSFENSTHVVYIRSYENYKTDKIVFSNFNTQYINNKVYEIEVYNEEKQIDYQLDKNLWLKDGIKDDGKFLLNDTFTLYLDDFYKIDNLKVVINYSYLNPFPSSFAISFENEFEPIYIEEVIPLDDAIGKNKTTIIKPVFYDEYESYLSEQNLLVDCNMNHFNWCGFYSTDTYKYKHYNIEKLYYIAIDLDNIEGYIYDEDDDIKLYRKYKRDIITVEEESKEEKEEIDTTIIKDNIIDKELESLKEEQKPLEEVIESNNIVATTDIEEENVAEIKSKSDNEKKYIKYHVIPVTNNIIEIPENNDNEKCSCPIYEETCEEDKCEKFTNISNENNDIEGIIKILVIIIIVLVIIFIFFAIIHLLNKRFTKNND